LTSVLGGFTEKQYLDNPFQRFNINLEQYPHFLDDMDDVSFLEYDNYERLKPFDPKEYVGETMVSPIEDND
jgi:hypothetical protein